MWSLKAGRTRAGKRFMEAKDLCCVCNKPGPRWYMQMSVNRGKCMPCAIEFAAKETDMERLARWNRDA